MCDCEKPENDFVAGKYINHQSCFNRNIIIVDSSSISMVDGPARWLGNRPPSHSSVLQSSRCASC